MFRYIENWPQQKKTDSKVKRATRIFMRVAKLNFQRTVLIDFFERLKLHTQREREKNDKRFSSLLLFSFFFKCNFDAQQSILSCFDGRLRTIVTLEMRGFRWKNAHTHTLCACKDSVDLIKFLVHFLKKLCQMQCNTVCAFSKESVWNENREKKLTKRKHSQWK